MHIRSLSACAIFAVAAFSPNLASAAPVHSNADKAPTTVRGIRLRERDHTSELVGLTAPGGADLLPRAYSAADDQYADTWDDEDAEDDDDNDDDADDDAEDESDTESSSSGGPAAALMRRNLEDYSVGIADVPPVPMRRNIDQLIKARNKLVYPRKPWEWKRAFDSKTAGGDAYTGTTGDSSGGSVVNSGHDLFAIDSNNGLDGARLEKRISDLDTLGGNAHSGNTGDVSGGTVANLAENDGMPTLMNMNSNNAGVGGTSSSCGATGGLSNDKGYGGNAYAGSAGKAVGGSVENSGGIINMGSNNAGDAGSSEAGCAIGGDA